ncbi:hypothetical protein MCGE09_00024 [Thaumarchaeota archaeon SCGC AB-539-E09]|nr:hypothetical protein MCGE09_00024 [Thaumarchaeota archaeon SCGC AB-539-E09]
MSAREEKFVRMNLIREAVSNEARSFKDIVSLIYGANLPRTANRTLQYDLSGLRILGLVELREDGRYHSTDNRMTFSNKAELELAVKHSKKILFTDGYFQGFDDILPQAVPSCLMNPEHSLVLEHIKTGYYQEIYLLLLHYIEFEENHPEITSKTHTPVKFPIDLIEDRTLGSIEDEDEFYYMNPEDVPKELDSRIIINKGIRKNGKVENKTYSMVYKILSDNYELVKEYHDLRGLIASKIYTLVSRVENGIPLEGSCDSCPSRHVQIKQ